MSISFNNIPSNIRVPLFYAEVSNSLANTSGTNPRTLIIGQKLNTGTATAGAPVFCSSVSQAATLGGVNSMLHLMVKEYRKNDSFGEVWVLPLADDGSAVAAAGSFKFTAAASAAGTLSLYIAGTKIALAVTTAMTTANLATALAAAINATVDLPVTAAVNGSDNAKVDITARNGGAAGNDIDIRVNYLGAIGGEVTPTGLTYTLVAMTNGATNPSLTTPLANCGDQPFDFIVLPYNDSTSLNSIGSFLNDTAGRWSWSRKIYGHAFAAYNGTVGNATTLGTGRNDQHVSIMAAYDTPTPAMYLAAQYAGACAVSLRADPARPVQTLTVQGLMAPPVASRYLLTERNTLLWSGISTFTVGQDGTCYLENVVTTYQKNAFSQPDDSYLEVETMFQLMSILRQLETLVTSKYARAKLADDGTRSSDPNVVTPSKIRGDLIAKYNETEEQQGLVTNTAAFAAGLIVQRNSRNPNRVDVLYAPVLMAQLRVFATLVQFRLQ